MSSTFFATIKRLPLLTALACALCWLAGCGGSGKDATAVKVGRHTITVGEVEHWISVLKGRGSNGQEPGPPAPVPPHYAACLVYERAHPARPAAPNPPLPKQPRAYCEFEYHRFKLKALYLLISYQWIAGEAHELGIRLNKKEVTQQFAFFRKAMGLEKDAAYRRYLSFTRATTPDMLLTFELEQLTRAIEAKVVKSSSSPLQREQVLKRFGDSYGHRWLARTDCRSGYLVPICRQYVPGKPSEFSEFTPAGVPLTNVSNAG